MPDARVEGMVAEWINSGSVDVTVGNFVVIIALLTQLMEKVDSIDNVELYYMNEKGDKVKVDDITAPPGEFFDVSGIELFRNLKDVV